jgi:subtilisin family serine protease
MVANLAAAANAITVGSYDWNDQFHGQTLLDPIQESQLEIGGLSLYSTPGPRRGDEMVKPEVAAPGQWFIAPAVEDRYRPFNGTAASAAYVAGIVALMMEKDPSLTLGEIKQLLQDNATRDPRLGQTPHPKAGFGKLDYNAVTRIFEKM